MFRCHVCGATEAKAETIDEVFRLMIDRCWFKTFLQLFVRVAGRNLSAGKKQNGFAKWCMVRQSR
jgi:hypothetical protein